MVIVTDIATGRVFSSASAAARAYSVSNCSVMSAARWVWPVLGGARALSPQRWFQSASVSVDQVSWGRPSTCTASDCRRESLLDCDTLSSASVPAPASARAGDWVPGGAAAVISS